MNGIFIAIWLAYFTVAIFYIISGIILWWNEETIKHRIPSWFPLLHSFSFKRNATALNLVIMGMVLFVTGLSLTYRGFFGMTSALTLSLWEIFLSFVFYWKRKEGAQAVGHFVIHGAIVFFLILISL